MMWRKIVAGIGLIAICILMGTLVVNLLDNIDSNQKEVDSYQDRMAPDQGEMSPPNQDGSDQDSTSGAAKPE